MAKHRHTARLNVDCLFSEIMTTLSTPARTSGAPIMPNIVLVDYSLRTILGRIGKVAVGHFILEAGALRGREQETIYHPSDVRPSLVPLRLVRPCL